VKSAFLKLQYRQDFTHSDIASINVGTNATAILQGNLNPLIFDPIQHIIRY
jgi:hypothetical protein